MTPTERHDRLRTLQTVCIGLGVMSALVAGFAWWDAYDQRREYAQAQAITAQVRAREQALMALATAPIDGPAVGMTATWYGRPYHGRKTSSGVPFDMHALTCAHRTLPFFTKLRVSHGSRSVLVTVTDRGPEAWTGKDIDLSRAAFEALAPLETGVIRVAVRKVAP